jgi:hypothetical protein
VANLTSGVNLRRTEIACLVWLIQTTCGSPLMGTATYYFQSAGLADDVVSNKRASLRASLILS